eukprot:jgi/Chlat1/6239/Chrsp44S09045
MAAMAAVSPTTLVSSACRARFSVRGVERPTSLRSPGKGLCLSPLRLGPSRLLPSRRSHVNGGVVAMADGTERARKPRGARVGGPAAGAAAAAQEVWGATVKTSKQLLAAPGTSAMRLKYVGAVLAVWLVVWVTGGVVTDLGEVFM